MPHYTLGELESEIMEVLWSCKKCTVQDVLKALKKKRTIAYTTVATVLNRLSEKNLVKRNAEKNFHYFSPTVSRSEFSTSVASRFMNDFMVSFGDVAIPSFAGTINTLKEEDRKKLLELLEEGNKK